MSMPVSTLLLAALCSCSTPQPEPAQCPMVTWDAATLDAPTSSKPTAESALEAVLAQANAVVAEATAEQCDASCPMPSPEGGK